jgi:hypothetical protein
MIIVNKSDPSVVVEGASGAGLLRVLKYGETTSDSEKNHITQLLKALHSKEQWVVCNCRPGLSLVSSPALSVVQRKGVLFLRNLSSREAHADDCKFKYIKSLPWLSNQTTIPDPLILNEKVSIAWSNPARILLTLIVRSEWTSYDCEYSFLSMIKKVAKVAESISIEESPLSEILNQSAKNMFSQHDKVTKVSMSIIHSIDWLSQSLIRIDEGGERVLKINGGIIPVRPVDQPGTTAIEGPFLALVTQRVVCGEVIRMCAYIPVSERKFPVPILTEGERIISKIIRGYSEWIFKAEGKAIGFGKIISDNAFINYGFTLTSPDASCDVLLTQSGSGIEIEEGRLSVSESWISGIVEHRVKANALKSAIRKQLIN